MAEESVTPRSAARGAGMLTDGPATGPAAVALGGVDTLASRPVASGMGELDRVLGGGLVPGSVTLLGGEPGIGKSTLLLQALAGFVASGRRGLLVSAEESAEQVKQRAQRLGVDTEGLWLVAATDLTAVGTAIEQVTPDLVVVDSIQTVRDPELEPVAGSVTQVRGCAGALVEMAKATGIAVLVVGHVTKDGSLAGPRALEHVVDTVLTFEGERHHALRLLRAVKHRYGATGELGVFEMGEAGLRGVADAGAMFLGDRRQDAPGSVVFPAMEGHRPLLVELQALVAPTSLAMPRRSASGVDGGRLALLIAVLERRADVRIGAADVYASVAGGIRVVEPGADLALCLALTSSLLDRPVAADLVAIGEVGLAGELRQVGHLPRRLAEAARLGFRRALLPRSAGQDGPLQVLGVSTLAEAVSAVFGVEGAAAPAAQAAAAGGWAIR